jgi:nicotinate-nucleotide adenylyltransferase
VRIAILGGTFDPIHNGHLRAAQAVSEVFELDEVHFTPAFVPPHKASSGITSAFHRFAMVAIAIAPFSKFRVSPIEADTLKSRYSVETLESMHRTYPDSSFLFVVGTDMFHDITGWKDYRRLLELTSFAVVNRRGFAMREDIAPVKVVGESASISIVKQRQVYYLPFINEEVSATKIREEAKNENSLEVWVPPGVSDYISRHKLYQ